MKACCMWYIDQGPPKRWKCVVHNAKLQSEQHSVTLAIPCRKSGREVDPARYERLVRRRDEQIEAFNREARARREVNP